MERRWRAVNISSRRCAIRSTASNLRDCILSDVGIPRLVIPSTVLRPNTETSCSRPSPNCSGSCINCVNSLVKTIDSKIAPYWFSSHIRMERRWRAVNISSRRCAIRSTASNLRDCILSDVGIPRLVIPSTVLRPNTETSCSRPSPNCSGSCINCVNSLVKTIEVLTARRAPWCSSVSVSSDFFVHSAATADVATLSVINSL